VRGRGSQGVLKVDDFGALTARLKSYLAEEYELEGVKFSKFGSKYMVEEYLCNEEITVTVLPPGTYHVDGKEVRREVHWSLPVVERFIHQGGIAPYSGVRAVTSNSCVVPADRSTDKSYAEIARQCEKAALYVDAVAPIRIDCRRDREGNFRIFDLNMKPSMTGPGRPARGNQDSLTSIAARAIGWSYGDLLSNVLRQKWIM
jgi:D-alanine-D-alanine ligase